MPEEFVIVTDVLAPAYIKTIELTGIHLSKILKEVPGILQDVLRVESKDIYEDQIKWDVSGEPVEYYGAWRGIEGKDRLTTNCGIVVVHGKQFSKDKNGNITVWIRGNLSTKYETPTAFHKFLGWLWFKIFYADRRQKYLVEAKEKLDIIEATIRESLGAPPKAVRE